MTRRRSNCSSAARDGLLLLVGRVAVARIKISRGGPFPAQQSPARPRARTTRRLPGPRARARALAPPRALRAPPSPRASRPPRSRGARPPPAARHTRVRRSRAAFLGPGPRSRTRRRTDPPKDDARSPRRPSRGRPDSDHAVRAPLERSRRAARQRALPGRRRESLRAVLHQRPPAEGDARPIRRRARGRAELHRQRVRDAHEGPDLIAVRAEALAPALPPGPERRERRRGRRDGRVAPILVPRAARRASRRRREYLQREREDDGPDLEGHQRSRRERSRGPRADGERRERR